uniref:hypothetical protein n=1 Tax=Methylobacterium sp. TaxID=409 RepID=UPI0020C89B7D|nr:hypothetical protein [Methylobacterium sp.]USU34672.1 hypothetical protein NG677_23955 [Methylobacterium sp.]
MSSITALAIFALFGGICGFYLSVVGFAITAIGVCLLVGIVSALLGGPYTPLLLFGTFITQQVGFFVSVMGRAVAAHIQRLRAHPSDSAAAAELRSEQDRT